MRREVERVSVLWGQQRARDRMGMLSSLFACQPCQPIFKQGVKAGDKKGWVEAESDNKIRFCLVSPFIYTYMDMNVYFITHTILCIYIYMFGEKMNVK